MELGFVPLPNPSSLVPRTLHHTACSHDGHWSSVDTGNLQTYMTINGDPEVTETWNGFPDGGSTRVSSSMDSFKALVRDFRVFTGSPMSCSYIPKHLADSLMASEVCLLYPKGPLHTLDSREPWVPQLSYMALI
jgi:hypothetical protein